jgi:hypothetical protein
VEACYKACGITYQGSQDNANHTFDDASKIWDGRAGTKDGYYDAQIGKTKPDVKLPYQDSGDANEHIGPKLF